MDNTSHAQQTNIANVLFCRPVFTTTAAKKKSFLIKLIICNEEILSGNQCSSLVTDGAGAILGVRQGFHARAKDINPLNPELNPMCYLLALLGAHHFLHVSRIRVKSLTFRQLMSYIYIYMPLVA